MFRVFFAFILETNPTKKKPQNIVYSQPAHDYYWSALDIPDLVICGCTEVRTGSMLRIDAASMVGLLPGF